MEKLEWCSYPSFDDMITRFDTIHELGRQQDRRTHRTDGRTDAARRHRPRLCIASRGKKMNRQFQPTTSITVMSYLSLDCITHKLFYLISLFNFS